MNNTDNPGTNSWEKIQSGVRDTERLIGQKKYNMAMIKARQTLEFMVKCLCEKSGVMQGNLIDMIDGLYDDGIISKTTCEHYHKIRTIGNKAIHEEDNSAYNANQAHHLLSQEVYTFANDYNERRRKPAPAASARRRTDESPGRRSSSGGSSSRRRRVQSSGPSFDAGSIIKPLLLIAIIVVLIFIIKMIHPGKEKVPETTAPAVSTEMTEPVPTESESPAEEPTTEAATVKYKVNADTLNVRATPATDGRIVVQLARGAEVEYVRDHDDRWCIIRYNGQDAYVAKEYLTPVTE